MAQPGLLYCVRLSRKLKKPIHEVLSWSVTEISLQIAYDLTKSEDYIKKVNDEHARETWHEIPLDERKELMRMVFNK